MHELQSTDPDRLMRTNSLSHRSPVRWNHVQLLLLGFLALVAVVYAFRLKSNLGFVDEQFYYQIALHLRHLHTFSLYGAVPTAIRPPGYPWALACIQSIHEGVRFAKAANLLLWLGAAALTAGITRRLFGQRAATISILFILGYAVELYTAGALYPQALASALFLLSLWLHFAWRRSGSIHEVLLQSVTWTALILTVPTFLFNFIIYLAWLAWKRRPLLHLVIPALIVAAALTGWSARNHAVFHAKVFVSDNSGEMLFYGNSSATGSNTGPQVPIWQLAPKAAALPDELGRENGYKQAAVEWIRANPKRALVLYVEKTLNWFNFRTNLYTAGKSSRLYDVLIAASYYPLLLAALASPFLLPAQRRLQAFLAAQYLTAALGYAIFFTRIRYRLPYDYLLIILAAGTVAALLDRRKQNMIQQAGSEAIPAEELAAPMSLQEGRGQA